MVSIIAPRGGTVKSDTGMEHKVTAAISTTESVLYDAVYIPGGKAAVDAIMKEPKFLKFVNEALKHCKAIAADAEGEKFLDNTYAGDFKDDPAICINSDPKKFEKAIALHRNWKRMDKAAAIPV